MICPRVTGLVESERYTCPERARVQKSGADSSLDLFWPKLNSNPESGTGILEHVSCSDSTTDPAGQTPEKKAYGKTSHAGFIALPVY